MIDRIDAWFVAAVPEPTDKNRSVQIGCHYEEVGEMADALHDMQLQEQAKYHADYYKSDISRYTSSYDRAELLDSLCDQIVTAVGVAHMFGLDIEGALDEVVRSNWSKFVDGKPVFDANGKIAKGPGYFKPNLAPYL